MEGLQGTWGTEGGSGVEFHDIPNNPSTNNIRSETPGTMDRIRLPILLRILQENGRPLPIGSSTGYSGCKTRIEGTMSCGSSSFYSG